MHWLSHLWFGYFWPSLQGNGPEALVQTVVYGAIAVILIPPVRKWVKAHFDGLKAHITAAHARVDAEQAELHRKLDHIIRFHPDIPELPPKEK